MERTTLFYFEVNDNYYHLPQFARAERLELPTPGFGDQCSTN